MNGLLKEPVTNAETTVGEKFSLSSRDPSSFLQFVGGVNLSLSSDTVTRAFEIFYDT